MGEVFSKEALNRRALDELRRQARCMSTGELAGALGVPTWALEPVLDEARRADEVQFTEKQGWVLAPERTSRRAAADDGDQDQGRMDLQGVS